jgi:small subunit ribosomal protein S9
MYKKEINKFKKFYGTGRRKTSSARVWIFEGTGKIQINNKNINEYLPRMALEKAVTKPFNVIGSKIQFDVFSTVKGGGLSGQSGAITNGIVKAILSYNEKYKPILKKWNLTTRDSRIVERKKCGQAGARKKFQYSKR